MITDVPLLHYKSLVSWTPKIGDLVIKYGWISRTKWFGLVKEIDKDGTIELVTEGTMILVAKLPANVKTIKMHYTDITGSYISSYSVMQNTDKTSIWYL